MRLNNIIVPAILFATTLASPLADVTSASPNSGLDNKAARGLPSSHFPGSASELTKVSRAFAGADAERLVKDPKHARSAGIASLPATDKRSSHITPSLPVLGSAGKVPVRSIIPSTIHEKRTPDAPGATGPSPEADVPQELKSKSKRFIKNADYEAGAAPPPNQGQAEAQPAEASANKRSDGISTL